MTFADPLDRPPSKRNSAVIAWLRLVRLPNLLTVPGDAVAGYVLSIGASAEFSAPVLWAAAAGLIFYVAGLILNDLADVDEDRRNRPDRPIAAGLISTRAAWRAALAALGLGLVFCSASGWRCLAAGCALAVAVAAYNFLPRSGILPIILLGACRALNVGLGIASAGAGNAAAWIGAGMVGLYVAALSLPARGELSGERPGFSAWLPMAALLTGGAALVLAGDVSESAAARAAVPFLVAVGLSGAAARQLCRGPRSAAPAAVGSLIGALMPLQSALILASGGHGFAVAAAIAVMLAWPANRLLARAFAPS